MVPPRRAPSVIGELSSPAFAAAPPAEAEAGARPSRDKVEESDRLAATATAGLKEAGVDSRSRATIISSKAAGRAAEEWSRPAWVIGSQ